METLRAILIGLVVLIVISELHGIKVELEVLNQKIGINKKGENKND